MPGTVAAMPCQTHPWELCGGEGEEGLCGAPGRLPWLRGSELLAELSPSSKAPHHENTLKCGFRASAA